MKLNLLFLIALISIALTACGPKTADASIEAGMDLDKTTTTEFQIDDTVQIENADEDVAKLNHEEIEEEVIEKASVENDMTLFTPEDIVLLDNLGNQDWGFEEDPTWILRFNDDLLIIGQENGQVTDVLRYHITSINHEQQALIIHVVERLNEHSQIQETTMNLNYYCELIIDGDKMTYRNKINDKNQLTETVWLRK